MHINKCTHFLEKIKKSIEIVKVKFWGALVIVTLISSKKFPNRKIMLNSEM